MLKISDMETSYKEKYEQAIERLKQWDREHPCAGYVLSDRDKFIFPELAENKDERIRKALKQYFVNSFQNNGVAAICGVRVKDVFAWLEKQGEKPKENKGNVGEISPNWSEEDKAHIESILERLEGMCKKGATFTATRFAVSQDIDWLNSLKDRVQPKQEWSEEEIEPIISDYLCGREHYGGMIGRLCHLKPKQKQTEWGEDDEAFLDDILCKLEHDLILNKDEKDWLKSLKLQPEQSLDEDTQQWIDTIIKDYEDLYNTDKDHSATIQAKISILKSLRPQNKWKPSDEQMEALNWHIGNTSVGSWQYKATKELMADLKKLKGEV